MNNPLYDGKVNLFLYVTVAMLSIVLPLASPSVWSYNTNRKSPKGLKMDEALLTIHNELLNENLTVSWMCDHCYHCLFLKLGHIDSGPASTVFTISTTYPVTLQVNSTKSHIELCRVYFNFGEFGAYSLWIKNMNPENVSCSIITDREPQNSLLPILIAFFVYTGFAASFALGRYIMRLDAVKSLISRVCRIFSAMETDRLINSELGSPNQPSELTGHGLASLPVPRRSVRLRSLDTFRGLSLIIMVFVNYGGGKYWFFKHESWNGITVADLVFPWFVFIMGTSTALSVNSLLRKGLSRLKLFRKVFWRSLQLFLIGVFIINPNYCLGPLSWGTLRIPGVLQRIAFSYLVVAVLEIMFAQRKTESISMDVNFASLQEFVFCWPSWICIIIVETIWLCLTFLLPVPGCPLGYLGPGGIGDFGQYPNCTGGAAGYIDRWFLGENHIYQNPSSHVLYQSTVPYDPEGILGSLNSVVMTFLGLQAGKILIHYKDLHMQIMAKFLMWGLFLGILSAVLTRCSKDKGFIPVNKNLWSLSYITTLSCFAFVALMIIYYLVDVKRCWSGIPFFYTGMNSILVYVGHEVLHNYFPFQWRMSDGQSHAEHLTQNLLATTIWVFIAYLLYRKNIFWKI
ncbi:heparan-alpha-glucosaminide N-acetyltransferase isoform X1 [Polypterus senegalus]|nr:heparan-alpha-glucosaminide N-acetyltransferase isoform X1 [Polypterus senegalus]